jgi:hypothetical protein
MANPGTISGGVTLNQPGVTADSKAMTFDGSTGKIALASLSIPSVATIEAWGKNSIGDGLLLSVTSPELDVGVGMSAGPKSKCYAGNSTYGLLPLGTGWHHLAYVLNGTSVTFYVDGVADITVAQPGRTVPNTGGTMIGCVFTAGHSFWTGAIQDVAIYPRALSAAEIAAHYALRRP